MRPLVPRLASPLLLAVATLGAGACVPKGQHEETVAALDAERARAEALSQERDALAERLAEAERRVLELEERAAAATLAAEIAERKRAEAEGIVDQLRGELARLSEHIEHFAQKSQRLDEVRGQLAHLEQDVAHRLATFEALSEVLGDVDRRSGVSVITVDGFPAIRFAAGSAVSARGFNDEAKSAVGALADLATDGRDTDVVVVFLEGNDASRSVAVAVADAVKERAPTAHVEALAGEDVDRGTAIALIRRRPPGEAKPE